MNDTIPNKLVLTCTVTGKQVTWTNKTIIAAKIAKFGSLEAFVKQFTCKGAGKKETIAKTMVQAPVMKAVMEQGKAMGDLTHEQYEAAHPSGHTVPSAGTETATSVFPYDDGSTCTVTAPKQSGTDEANRRGRSTVKAPRGKINKG